MTHEDPKRDSRGPTSAGLLASTLDYLVEWVMALTPQNALGMALKRPLLRQRGTRLGSRVKIWRGVWIDNYRRLAVGDDVTIGHSVMLLSGGGIDIRDRAMVGHGARLISSGHRIPPSRSEPMRWTGPAQAPIVIDEDSWVGAGAIILGGVRIGIGAIVGAGAVVTRDVPDYAVVAGVPAKIARYRE